MYHSKLGLGFYVLPMWSLMTICQKLLTPMTSGSKKEQGFKKEAHKRRRHHYHGVKAAEVAIARSGLAKKILILSFLLH
jgi:hypothetical protein